MKGSTFAEYATVELLTCLFIQLRPAALRLIVRSWLEVSTLATRRLHACHHARAPSGGRWNCGRGMSGNFAEMKTFTPFLGSFTCRKATTWDRRLYFPSEGRRAKEFFALKIRRLRPGVNPRTWIPKAKSCTSCIIYVEGSGTPVLYIGRTVLKG